MRTGVIAETVGLGDRADLAPILTTLSKTGQLAGYEATERFYEVGSPDGLRALEEELRR